MAHFLEKVVIPPVNQALNNSVNNTNPTDTPQLNQSVNPSNPVQNQNIANPDPNDLSK